MYTDSDTDNRLLLALRKGDGSAFNIQNLPQVKETEVIVQKEKYGWQTTGGYRVY